MKILPQVAGVAKQTPADKQMQRDAKAIVKKSMVLAALSCIPPLNQRRF
jgi:hypothetical protein